LERDPRLNPEVGDMWTEGPAYSVNSFDCIVLEIVPPMILMDYGEFQKRWIQLKTFRKNCKFCWEYSGKCDELRLDLLQHR
jgi:hypothetical protein